MTTENGAGSAEQEQAVRIIVSTACLEVLASYGVHTGPPPHAGAPLTFTEPELAGFIGFNGPVGGSLVIAASSAFFHSTYPAGGPGAVTPADLLDWAGEMANQILGRIKRRFCDHGATFDAGHPTAIKGRYIVRRAGTSQVFDLVLASGNEALYVCFQIMVPEDVGVFPTPAQPILCAEEGELVLF